MAGALGWRSISRRAAIGLIASIAALAMSPAVAQLLSSLRPRKYRIGNRAIGLAGGREQVRSGEAFSENERAIVTRLVEIIVPSDGLPGARETGTSGAVLFALGEQDARVLEGLRQAIGAVDAISIELFGQTFTALSDDAAEQVTGIVAEAPELAPFWSAVRTLTVLDFYAHEAGYEPLGLPGPSIDRGGFPDGRSTPGTVLCQS